MQRDDPLGAEFAQADRIERARPAGSGAQRLSPPDRHRRGLGDVAERRRLESDPAEQPGGPRRHQQIHRRQRARRLPGERDLGGVAAEGAGDLARPLECGDLVEQAPVRGRRVQGRGQVGVAEPAEAAQPVVDGHDHRVGGRRQALAGVQARAGVADREPAAVEPYEHGTAVVEPRREHVQIEALLIGGGRLTVGEPRRRALRLRRRRARADRVPNPAPARLRAGWGEPRRGRVRDPSECHHLAGATAAEPAGGDLHLGHGATAPPLPPSCPRPVRDAPPPRR